MKHKRLKIIISAAVSLCVLAAIGYFQFTRDGYRFSIPCRASFVEIGENVYVNRDYAAQKDELCSLVEDAQARVTDFWGERQAKPYIILCNDPKLSARIGEKDTYSYPFGDTFYSYICISEEYCNIDILSHELTHAELHDRLGAKLTRSVPSWFDEGIATQNDWREKYDISKWDGSDAVTLDDMDTHAEFYAGTPEERHQRYLSAKRELAAWMETHHREGLLALIDSLKSGTDFDDAYTD